MLRVVVNNVVLHEGFNLQELKMKRFKGEVLWDLRLIFYQ